MESKTPYLHDEESVFIDLDGKSEIVFILNTVIFSMQVDDDSLFREYYSLRQNNHVPIQRFIEDHHLRTTVRKFYNSYRRWLLANNLKYIYWNAREYLEWYGRYYRMDKDSMSVCFTILDVAEKVREEFNPLTLATTIFIIGSGKLRNEVITLSGLSPTPVNQCLRWITDNKIYSPKGSAADGKI